MAVGPTPPAGPPPAKQATVKSSTGGQGPPPVDLSGTNLPKGSPTGGLNTGPEEPTNNEAHPPPKEGEAPVEGLKDDAKTPPEQPPQPQPPRLTEAQVALLADPDILALATQLELTGIASTAPATSRFAETPKGYKLLLETDPRWFFGKRNEWRQHEKRKRSFGVPNWGQNRRYGFRPEELLWTGALDLDGVKPSDLDIEIHPLLSHDNFDDCPQEVYNQLMPACRLATMFLTKDVCMQYWVTLAKGTRENDIGKTISSGVRQERIREDVPLTAANVAEIRRYLMDLQQAENPIRFTFQPAMPLQNAYAASSSICDYNFKHRLHPGRQFRHALIFLHQDYYTTAVRLSQLQYPDEAQKLRFNFLLANTLVHELAHAVQMGHVNDETRGPEVFLYDANRNELGEAWESKTWGGRVLAVNSRCDGSHGVAVCDWPLKNVFFDSEHEHNIWYSVPMGFIENIQQKKTWCKKYALNETPFRIPRTGAQSVEIIAFTTMKLSEEERIIREEMQEAANEANEQPQQKRGRLGTGEVRRTTPEREDIFGPDNPPTGPRNPGPQRGASYRPRGIRRSYRGRGREDGRGVPRR